MAVSKAYDDLIMDHIKNARGFRVLADATHHAGGSNPLCGDEVTVYLTLAGERIESAAFQCTCCGISMASASIMTESVRGKGRAIRPWVALEAALDNRSEPVALTWVWRRGRQSHCEA